MVNNSPAEEVRNQSLREGYAAVRAYLQKTAHNHHHEIVDQSHIDKYGDNSAQANFVQHAPFTYNPPHKERPLMTTRDFVFWLNGFFEITGNPPSSLSEAQTKIVKEHLDLVFRHEFAAPVQPLQVGTTVPTAIKPHDPLQNPTGTYWPPNVQAIC
jgi:hypothetical protein